jgi:glycosyltransferase involved in cell wall biosynthesis
MSTLRYDPAHQRGPMGRGDAIRRMLEDEPDRAEFDWEIAREGPEAAPSFLTVVVPAKNEAASLPQLVEEIARALRPLPDFSRRPLAGFEIMVVDDASTDRTPEVLRALADDYPELRGLVLADGVGQSSATLAGIRAARGDWIATLDADLQNDPADLVRLWEALPGHDAALGWRVERHDVWSRRVISRWANRVRNGLLGQSIRDTGCSVRIFPRAVALRLPAFRGVHRFFGPLLLREGCRLVQVPVGHRPRPHGRSHYNLWNRSIQVVVDLLGIAWLLRRPLQYRVIEAWDAVERDVDGAIGSRAFEAVEN